MAAFRFHIGIDLGTTNCALSYVDLLGERPESRMLEVLQLSGHGQIESRMTMPSCCYIATPEERKRRTLQIEAEGYESPPDAAVGVFAFEQLAAAPGRVVQSAKSWLSHSEVDRLAPILPWGSEEVEPGHKVSPVEASARYLRQLGAAWNASVAKHQPEYRFELQDITITVPASFDEDAQRLTLQAAQQAGYPAGVRLVEEPQAAFYRWLEHHTIARDLAPAFDSGSITILVCDIGGGTTDFSLFSAALDGEHAVPIERVAVSDHILLGGDNIDLTLAHTLEGRLGAADKLAPRQWAQLVFQARQLKEKVLQAESGAGDEAYFISVAGKGSGLFSAALTAQIRRQEIEKLLLDGFFPLCEAGERPHARAGGLREWGLPFVADTAVTRHLAGFLKGRHVDAVLFNGGSLKPAFLRRRLIDAVARWQDGRTPIELENPEMDLTVARGAARFGWIVQKRAGKIRGGYPRSLYLELQAEERGASAQLVCVLPKGFEEGESLSIDKPSFMLVVDRPARFQLFSSTVRRQDRPGDLVVLNADEFHPLPPLQTMLSLPAGMTKPGGGLIPVTIDAALTNTGLLELYCSAEGHRWRLDFQVRGASAQGPAEEAESGAANRQIQQCAERIYYFYGKGKRDAAEESATPRGLVRELERILGKPRAEWNLPLLRALWPPLAKGITRRGRSLQHECTWLNLSGYCLRPGYGGELDGFRMLELWRVYELGLAFPKEGSALVQWWVMWRRVAGGLNREQQNTLYGGITRSLASQGTDTAEMFRLASSLERIDLDARLRIGDLIVKRLLRKGLPGQDQFCWSLGRLASRIPLYGELHCVVPPSQVLSWFERLSSLNWSTSPYSALNAAFAQACRLTGDRSRDVPSAEREKVLRKMSDSGAGADQLQLLVKAVPFAAADQSMLFGESLPAGLRVLS